MYDQFIEEKRQLNSVILQRRPVLFVGLMYDHT